IHHIITLNKHIGKDLPETEKQYGDDFVILASHILIDLYLKYRKYFIFNDFNGNDNDNDYSNGDGDDNDVYYIFNNLHLFSLIEKVIYLIQAIFLLESALEKSKNNFQFKLLLIRLYQ